METFGLTTLSFWYLFLFILLFVLLACAGWKAYKKKKRDIEDYKDPPDYRPTVFGRRKGEA